MMQVCVTRPESRCSERPKVEEFPPSGDFSFEIVDFDENLPDHDELVRSGLVVERYTHFKDDELARARAHKSLWERCVVEGEPLIVLFDQTIVRADFVRVVEHALEQLPPDWEFLLLGYSPKAAVEFALFPGQDLYGCVKGSSDLTRFVADQSTPVVLPLNTALGDWAYAISPAGARSLLAHCFPLAGLHVGIPASMTIYRRVGTLELIMNSAYARMKAFCLLPAIAAAVDG